MEKQVENIGSKAAKAMVEKKVLGQQEAAKIDYEKTHKLINQAFIKQDTEEAVFRVLLEDAFKLLEACEANKDVVPPLRKVQQALEASLAGCKVANEKYLEFLSREAASTEVGWILVVQKWYNQVVDRIESVIANQTEVEVGVKNLEAKTTNLRLKKMKMPPFSGELREYWDLEKTLKFKLCQV